MAENTNDMQRMQQDAIRRVHEMQSRAQQTLNRTQSPPELTHPQEPTQQRHQNNPAPPHGAPPGAPPHGEPPHQEPPPSVPPNTLSNLFDGLLRDGERTLILVLILILVSEKADTGMIFALMYLII